MPKLLALHNNVYIWNILAFERVPQGKLHNVVDMWAFLTVNAVLVDLKDVLVANEVGWGNVVPVLIAIDVSKVIAQ